MPVTLTGLRNAIGNLLPPRERGYLTDAVRRKPYTIWVEVATIQSLG